MPVSDQGVSIDRYQLIPRVLIFATRKNSVLLLKGAPTKRLWANLYNGLGGHVERGEDIFTAAKREFLEETGLTLLKAWICAIITIDTNEPVGIGMYVFRGIANQGEPLHADEGSLAWVPFQKLHEFPLVEDLHKLLPKVLDMKIGEPPLIAHYHYIEKKLVIAFA